MQIEIKLDENCKEPKIIVVTNKMTDEINEIMKRLSDEQPKMIAGFKDDIVEVLEPFDIIYAIIISEIVNQSTFVVVYVSERGCGELDRSIH